MGAFQDTIFFLIFLGVLVTVHEAGHFLAAKWAGVKVLKFSIGFGPKLFGFRRGETEYQIAALPLGGFVAMAGQYPGEEDAEEDPRRTFLGAPWWKRFIILAAGPAFNLIFPIFAYWIVFLAPHQITSSRVGAVEAGFPAAAAGIRAGDVVTKIDGKDIEAFDEIRAALDGVYDREVPVTVKRGEQELTLRIVPRRTEESTPLEKVQRGLLGISSRPRPAIIGVPAGSAAATAGLETFDRVLTVNGRAIRDELALTAALDEARGPLEVQVVRSQVRSVGGAGLVVPKLVTVKLEKGAGPGLASIGAEMGDLYVWTVFPGSPAEKLGLKKGDRLLSVDGTPITSWYVWQMQLQVADKKPFTLAWRSGAEARSASTAQIAQEHLDELKNRSEVLEFGLRPRASFQGVIEVLAAGPEEHKLTVDLNPGQAFVAAVKTVPEGIRVIALIMGKLFTRDIPLESVGGPIMLFQVAARSAEAGYETFLKNMALVSVNLGLVNLLPIPILDGFGLLAALWEGVRRRPIPVRAREYANMVGFAMLAVLLVLVFKNDITKLLR